jgi:hypothetical protein
MRELELAFELLERGLMLVVRDGVDSGGVGPGDKVELMRRDALRCPEHPHFRAL